VPVLSLALLGCGNDGGGDDDGTGGDDGGTGGDDGGTGGDGGGTGGDDGGTGGDDGGGDGSGGDDGGTGDDGGDPPEEICDPPIQLADISNPTTVVGNGDPASCTEAQLAAAVAEGGVITFDCGDEPVTIDITSTLELRIDVDTVIDGEGLITLDGGDAARIFNFYSDNFRVTTTRVVLQRLTVQNARAPATDFTPQPPNSNCAWGYKDGAGSGLFMRDGVLEVIDCTFRDNAAASPGPDVGGGAIYAVGSLGVTVVGSRFIGNEGSNSGAIGLLQSTGTFVNTVFDSNSATGEGANYVEPGCPPFNHDEQGGAGGNGGAMAVDGVEETELYFCGCVFQDNQANELGGGVFRTPNASRQLTTFDRCTVDGNQANGGGGMYISNSLLTISASTISNNIVDGLGGGVRTGLSSELDLVNVTFYNNATTAGLAGALSYGDGGGTIRNCTFADNKAEGGPGLFTAAIRGTSAAVHNTIFANNTTADPWNPMSCDFEPASGANNFQWPEKRQDSDNDDTPCVENITWADAELSPLADNGGPTRTMIPNADIVVGAGQDCPPTDQRGEPRPDPSACTAGAVEP
jgi:hypothetical protein